jgi:uncharacterized protein (TIGR04255 family)
MTYEYPRYKLHRDPLSLVLCQLRFSAIRKMPELVPDIQDRLRRKGFPNDASSEVQSLVISQGPQGTEAEPRTVRRDEFRSKDQRWSLVIASDMLALVTTAYDRYHGFNERLRLVLEEVDAVAELSLTQVHRLGIRYVDVIDPGDGETYRDYLREPFHGVQSDVYVDGHQAVQSQTVGRTRMGTLTVRVWQNNQGQVVPPDIMQGASPMPPGVEVQPNRLITLVDTDHATQGAWDYDLDSVLETADALHQGINRAWFNDIITPHALKAWGAENATE